MKSYDRLIAAAAAIILLVFVIINTAASDENSAQLHTIEISRVERMIADTGEIPDISACETVIGIYPQTDGESLYDTRSDYVIREIGGRLYRIEYAEKHNNSGRVYLNAVAGFFAVLLLGTLLYIRRHIIKPFSEISNMPYELAKGELTVPLRESKKRYFGKFLWGLDMLREKLESSKQSELALQKEKKTMLMSLSHDIKTPLSAIKLYSAAISKGIYTEPEKQREAAGSINAKADEIEQLVNEIMHANSEDIMRFDVKEGEFYLSEVIDRIRAYYLDKLSGTVFSVEKYTDCIINGDPDRLTEVLQNLIENAIKYGDGRSISISFSDEEDCRLVTVADSGCTLPEDELPHIFESFRRGSNVGSRSGNGLGLYICRRLMSAMNGDIFAEIRDGEMRVTAVCRKK